METLQDGFKWDKSDCWGHGGSVSFWSSRVRAFTDAVQLDRQCLPPRCVGRAWQRVSCVVWAQRRWPVTTTTTRRLGKLQAMLAGVGLRAQVVTTGSLEPRPSVVMRTLDKSLPTM